eukprot:GFUD01029578.1.p1 GENE.GFUD01029578.1~~GFUD01029578.1.p1  ORF type:complete len:936 (-),score=285.22 GFUD01029578.1:126-2933(-)
MTSCPMDSIDNYQVSNLLGKGGFASVYKARCISSGLDVAIKMVDKQQMNMTGMSGRVRQEVAIHSRLKHPAILELFTFFEDQNYVYLVLELCHNGELARFLKQNNTVFTEAEARAVFEQVVSGLVYLHSHGIMHRDLTLANLMLTRDMKIKIGDFGLATKLVSPGERHVTMCGTPNFISPEVATRSSHGLEADVWGLGCLLYTMLVGRPPFDTAGVRSTLTKVVMADFSLPEHLSAEVKDLISNLLKKNPTERIRLRDITSHPWMRADPIPPQDSGMYTMTTTNFSSNSSKPGPKPMSAYPVLTEYSEENEVEKLSSYFRPPQPPSSFPTSRSSPLLQPPSSPPVKMVSHPHDLLGVSQPPLTSLRSKLSSLPSFPTLPQNATPALSNLSHHSIMSQASHFPSLSRQFSNPETNRVLSNLQPMEVDNRSVRSNMSDPSKPQHNPTFTQNYNPTSINSQASQPQYIRHSTPQQPQYSAPTSSHLPLYNQPTSVQQPQYNPPSVSQPQYNPPPSLSQPQYNIVATSHQPQYNPPSVSQPQYIPPQPSTQPQFIPPNHPPSPTPSLLSLAPPLSSSRLRPTRQKTKNVMANISSSGEVCLEFIKVRRGEEKVAEVMRISGDGDRIVVYSPGEGGRGEGVTVGQTPPAIPTGGADAFYSYQTLPQKYWKKYQYAARFINLVKASTPKMTLYTSQAKCYVMENEGRDFEMYFYSGVKVTLISGVVKLIDSEGRTHTFSYPITTSTVHPSLSLCLTHLSSSYEHCSRVESLLSQVDTTSTSQPSFPIILGRKPTHMEHVSNNSLEKENRAPQKVGQGMADTMLSKMTTTSPHYQRSLPGHTPSIPDNTRKVTIPGVGVAMQLQDGNVRVNYHDSSCLVLRSQSSSVDYYQPSPGGPQHGTWLVFDSSNLPEGVKDKLAEMPKILELLMAGQPGQGRPASVR